MVAAHADIVVNRFNSAAELSTWRYDFGAGGGTYGWNSAEDAGGGMGLGSLQLNMPFPGNAHAFTTDAFSSPVDLSGPSFTQISFDLKVDASSATDAFGNNGYLDFVIRNTGSYDWTPQLGGNVNDANGWTHFSGPLQGSVNAVRAFTFQLYGGPGQNLPGAVTVYLDNIVVTQVPEPGAIAFLSAGVCLLTVVRRHGRKN